jgi:hypothetical protein
MLLAGLDSYAADSDERAEAVSPGREATQDRMWESSASYYETLRSLVGPKQLEVQPKPDGRDYNLIRPEKGAAGMLFGDSMDAVVDTWGKPAGIDINIHCPLENCPLWTLSIGTCEFGFVEGQLTTIDVHCVALPDAYMENGITFDSSIEEVKQAFGKPVEEQFNGEVLVYRTPGGYGLKFQFTRCLEGALKLIAIRLSRPDTYE